MTNEARRNMRKKNNFRIKWLNTEEREGENRIEWNIDACVCIAVYPEITHW